jgi:hypothetical protein
MAVSLSANVWNRVRRETGKELMVRVHYDEGAAIHIGPEFTPVPPQDRDQRSDLSMIDPRLLGMLALGAQ